MAVTGFWLSLRLLSLNSRRVIPTILASNHKRFKISENASYSTANRTSSTKFSFDTSNYSKIVESPGFVDKTLLLKEILHGPRMILITAPRRFAKSTNMDMVKKFVEIEVDEAGIIINRKESPNQKIFKDNNLLVFQDQKFFDQHFATYPVMHISFKNVLPESYAEILTGFRNVLRTTYSQHKYLLKSHIWSKKKLNIDAFKRYYDVMECETLDKDKIIKGFEFLSECLYYHFEKKVFVLIDEYDAPINKSLFEKDIDIERVNFLLGKIFLYTLKENEFVERALLTGISYFATVGLWGANNIKKYMFLDNHQFVEYYGLTVEEFGKLMSKFKLDDETKTKVKSYYNGYTSRNNIKLYSLWSVLNYLRTKKLQPYWEQSTLAYTLNKALNFPAIQMVIENLLKNESKKIDVFDSISLKDIIQLQNIIYDRTDKKISDPDLFFNFLLQQGYLTYEGTENNVRIPNKEVFDVLTKELYSFYGPDLNRVFDECSDAFIQISVSDNKSFKKFLKTFQSVVNKISPDIIKTNERIFHSLLFTVISKSKPRFCNDTRLVESKKRPDLIVKQRKNGYIIEIKFKQNSKKALQQIIDDKYHTNLDSEEFKDVEHKVCLGINVSKKLHVSLAVLVNNLDINEAVYFV